MTIALALIEGACVFVAARAAGGSITAVVLALCCVTALYVAGWYNPRAMAEASGPTARRLMQALVMAAVAMALPWLGLRAGGVPRDALLAGLGMTALVLPMRVFTCRLVHNARCVERVLVLGSGSLAHRLIRVIETRRLPYAVLGIVGHAAAATAGVGYRVLGRLDHLDRLIDELHPDRIVVAMAERRGQLPVSSLLECRARGIAIEDGLELYERLTGQLALESLAPSDVIFCRGFERSPLERRIARGLSVTAAVVGLLMLSPLLALIALAIKLESRGPVLFLHERVGAGGHRFQLIKFRTMLPVVGATSEWARDNEERITRVGRLLRKFRLDELPQFVNILRGDMDLVGPRPHPMSNVPLFAAHIPYYRLRSMARPGITGWAQVRYGYANGLEEEIEKMRYDLYYLKHASLWLDLRILFETVRIVLVGGESAGAEIVPVPDDYPETEPKVA